MWTEDGQLSARKAIGRNQPPLLIDAPTGTVRTGALWQKKSRPAVQCTVYLRPAETIINRGPFGRPVPRRLRSYLVVTNRQTGELWMSPVKNAAAAAEFIADWDRWRRAGMPTHAV